MKLKHNDGTLSYPEIFARLDNDETRSMVEAIKEKGFLSYDEIDNRIIDTATALTSGYPIKAYMHAMEFTSYRMAGDSQAKAYKKAFPERCVGKTEGAITGKASIYANGKLPIKLLAASQVPLDLLYMRETHKAIRKLSALIDTGSTDRIQMESADKLLGHIKPNEVLKIEHSTGDSTAEAISSLSESLNSIAAMAQSKLQSGTINAKQLIQR